jgi:hypothetical protein
VDEAAQAITSSDRTASRMRNKTLRGSICAWRAEVERAVWSVAVVMIDVDAQDALEVSTISDEQPIEALGAHGPHDRSATAFALGARNGVLTTSTPSLRKTSSNACLNLLSRSWIR